MVSTNSGPDGKDLDKIREELRNKGLKATKTRAEILAKVTAEAKHSSANEIYNSMKKDGIGRATVFRTLKLLSDIGLINKLPLAGQQGRFEAADAAHHHDHMVCLGCGKVIEFCDPKIEELQKKAAEKEGFLAEDHTMEIRGRCKECREKAGMPASGEVRLSLLEPGKTAVITSFSGGQFLQKKLGAMGLIAGRQITKVAESGSNGPVVIKAAKTEIAIGNSLADKIMVKPL